MALLERYMNNTHGATGYMGPPSLHQPGTNPLTAFSAYQPPSVLEQNPFLMAAQAAQALSAAHLHSQLQAALSPALPPLPPQLPPPAPGQRGSSPRSELSAGASEQSGDGETDDERRAPAPQPGSGVAGMKIPVLCNDVRGLVHLDQQVVGCYCPACEARVAAGYDRPLFSFTRFERHCGSKAKKWRLSLRIEPGAVKECPPGDGPMPLGQWMEMRGLMSWGARSTVKIGVRESDDDDTMVDGNYLRRAAVGPMSDRRAAGALAVLAGATAALPHREREPSSNARPLLPQKRERDEYDTPDLPEQADRGAWLVEQRRRFEAELAAGSASPAQQPQQAAGAGNATQPSDAGGSSASDGSNSEALVPAPAKAGSGAAMVGNLAGKHGAIFKLVYGLLEGADRRAFNESYLPWLNELPPQRLEQEFNTLLQYLQLLQDMPWQTVQGLMRAYLKAILTRVAHN